MIVLGLDGALGSFSVAVASDNAIVSTHAESGNVALERGLIVVKTVLAQAAVTPAEIGRLAVGIGPGGFTGLRIAISYAKSLAAAWQLPLVPISSFDLLEWGHSHGFDRMLTIVIGRPGVISARYRDGAIERRASGYIADVFDTILGAADERILPIIGGSEDVLAALAERAYIVESVVPVIAPFAAIAALAGALREPAPSIHEVRADYGELPAAKIPNLSRTI